MCDATDIDKLAKVLTKHPLHRELYRKILVHCREPKTLEEIEEEIARFPEFACATQSQVHLLNVLVNAGALARVEIDAAGSVILEASKEGLTEEETDDLVFDWMFETTNLGIEYANVNSVEKRFCTLLEAKPEFSSLYMGLLGYCATPRTYTEIGVFIKKQADESFQVASVVKGLEPSVLVDSLERAGSLVWNNGWVATGKGDMATAVC